MNSAGSSRQSYRGMEDRHWWYLGRRRIFRDVLERHAAGAMPEPRVLDVGTGSGAALDYLASFGEVTGVEPDPAAVAYCRERGHTNVVTASTPPIPFEAERFSLVTAFDVVEHVENDHRLVEEMARVLRPRGLCLVSVPAYQWLWSSHDEIAHHKRRYRRGEVEGLLRAAGLECVWASYFNMLLFFPIVAFRLAERLTGSSRDASDLEAPGGYGAINSLLARAFGSESIMLARVSLPFGVSILALGRKPPSASSH